MSAFEEIEKEEDDGPQKDSDEEDPSENVEGVNVGTHAEDATVEE